MVRCVVPNDREIRHVVILFAAGYALFHGRISQGTGGRKLLCRQC